LGASIPSRRLQGKGVFLPTTSSRIGGLNRHAEVALPQVSQSAESTSVLSRNPAVRAADPAGDLGHFSTPPGSPSSAGGKGDDEVLRFFSSWPLHRCVHADSGALGQCEGRFAALIGISVSDSHCSQPTTGHRHRRLGRVKASSWRGLGARSVCSGSVLWLQKSARGVGLRKATSVAAGVGDGGLAPSGGPRRGEETSRAKPAGNGRFDERSVEDCSLVEGVRDRGIPQSSRAAGGIGLGPPSWCLHELRG
jgi:hypothetical protein